MKYKALISDVDGTLIINDRHGIPSQQVIEAVNKASSIIHICLATGRPYFALNDILPRITISGPVIVWGGSRVVDIKTGKGLWEKSIPPETVSIICKIISPFGYPIGIADVKDGKEFEYYYDEGKKLGQAFQIFCQGLTEEDSQQMRKSLSDISTIAVHVTPSWVKGKIDILIGHVEATKQHGIFEVAKILGIETSDIVGIGDGGNDFPLLMACGLKVAMGNAAPELKAIADYIAPSVTDDGVANVIEKFILN